MINHLLLPEPRKAVETLVLEPEGLMMLASPGARCLAADVGAFAVGARPGDAPAPPLRRVARGACFRRHNTGHRAAGRLGVDSTPCGAEPHRPGDRPVALASIGCPELDCGRAGRSFRPALQPEPLSNLSLMTRSCEMPCEVIPPEASVAARERSGAPPFARRRFGSFRPLSAPTTW